MARSLKNIGFFFLIILVLINLVVLAANARPLNPPAVAFEGVGGFFDGLALGAIKQSGPSPGVGHKFTNYQTIGGIKDSGPSPGQGHSYVTGKNN